jgi:hypothetical protein
VGVKAQPTSPLLNALSSTGAAEDWLLYIGSKREDLTIVPIFLKSKFHFDVEKEARIACELGCFGEEDTVLAEELEIFYQALVD